MIIEAAKIYFFVSIYHVSTASYLFEACLLRAYPFKSFPIQSLLYSGPYLFKSFSVTPLEVSIQHLCCGAAQKCSAIILGSVSI